MKVRELIGDVKAFFRGEKRVAPYGATGRIYTQRNPDSEKGSGGHSQTTSKATGTLTMVITRADGTVETVVAPATGIKV